MSRWNIGARHQTPQSKLLEQEPSADGRRLTSGEVRFERLRLAHDMVTLVLTDGEGLPHEVRLELGAVREVLVSAWRTTRSLP
jgi:hypothetical protein